MKAIKTEMAIKCGGKHFKAGETLLVGKGKDISLKDAKFFVENLAAVEVVAPVKKKSEPIKIIEPHKDDDIFDIDAMSEQELRTLAQEEGITLPENADIEMIRQIIDEELGE